MYKLKIESLNCMSCFHNIDDVLKEYDSTIDASVDIRNQWLNVQTERPVEEIIKVVEAAGYAVDSFNKT